MYRFTRQPVLTPNTKPNTLSYTKMNCFTPALLKDYDNRMKYHENSTIICNLSRITHKYTLKMATHEPIVSACAFTVLL
ncbi:hypothetical protein WN48_00478 [Eufriesea mexicana]|uniref:Uncharacterized protein n=1 Tax=Eufriesea mexicana TaxID=516756 RepID=A0A310SEL7_9HYME|nr:hypothetical protein WN48_00478 [Eufriesea mexicana]